MGCGCGCVRTVVLFDGFGAVVAGCYPDQWGIRAIDRLQAWISSAAGQSSGPEIRGLPCGRLLSATPDEHGGLGLRHVA